MEAADVLPYIKTGDPIQVYIDSDTYLGGYFLGASEDWILLYDLEVGPGEQHLVLIRFSLVLSFSRESKLIKNLYGALCPVVASAELLVPNGLLEFAKAGGKVTALSLEYEEGEYIVGRVHSLDDRMVVIEDHYSVEGWRSNKYFPIRALTEIKVDVTGLGPALGPR